MQTTNLSTVKLDAPVAGITIQALQSDEDEVSFRLLNEEWITRFFELEESDRRTLNDPRASIIQKGGQVVLARLDGETVGCVALIPMPDGVYELSKMAVTPNLRGNGIGRSMLVHAIEYARLAGARSLFLGSSTKLANAVRLYESVGFRHVPAQRLPTLQYRRADVFMELLF
jgi:putative acetyltransferase